MSLKLNSSGGGSVTLQEPVTASTLTLNLPAFSGTAATLATVTNNGVLYVNSSGQPTSGSALTFDGTKLTVKGGNAGQFVLDNSNEQYVQQVFQRNGTANTGADFLFDGSASTFNIRTLAVAPIVFSVSASAGSPSEQMRLTSTGLGIGTSSPGHKLQVVGSGTVARFGSSAAQNAYAAWQYDSAILGYVGNGAGVANGAGATDFAIGSTGARNLCFGTNDTERARIHSGGAFSVLSTNISGSFSDNTPRFYITPTGASSSYLWHTTASADSNFYMNRTTGSGNYFLFGSGSTITGSVSTNGSTTSYNTSSDYRLKNTIAPMTGALAKVALLKPCTYKWNVDGSDGEGFIAHELAEVVPQCVTGEKDAVDAEGKPQYQGIDTSFLVATLTAAIQELKAEFDAYKSTHP